MVNAKELKQVPGRKSDVKDSQWIAHLLLCGLLNSSYVPDRGQRHLRDLTRHRAQLRGEHTRCVSRLLGVSGREMLAALVAGNNDPEKSPTL